MDPPSQNQAGPAQDPAAGAALGNLVGNSLGNSIGNSIGNPIGNTIQRWKSIHKGGTGPGIIYTVQFKRQYNGQFNMQVNCDRKASFFIIYADSFVSFPRKG